MKFLQKAVCVILALCVCFALSSCTGGGDLSGEEQTTSVSSTPIAAKEMKIGVLYFDRAAGGTASVYQKQAITAVAESLAIDEEKQIVSAVGITDVKFDKDADFTEQESTDEQSLSETQTEKAEATEKAKTTEKTEKTTAKKDADKKNNSTTQPKKVTTVKKPTALESVADFVKAKCNVIIATDAAYSALTEYLAGQLPDIIFLQYGSGNSKLSNLQYYSEKLYEGYYLAGAVAGALTKAQTIGFVYGTSGDVSYHNIYAFSKGIDTSNDKAQLLLGSTGVAYDLSLETTATNALIKNKCDVIAQNLFTALPQVACEKAKISCIGSYYDMSPDAKSFNILSVIINWEIYFKQVFAQINEGHFAGGAYSGGVSDGLVDVTDIRVDSVDAGKALEAARQKLKSGINPLEGYAADSEIFSNHVSVQ